MIVFLAYDFCHFSTCHWDKTMQGKSWAKMNCFSLSIYPHRGKTAVSVKTTEVSNLWQWIQKRKMRHNKAVWKLHLAWLCLESSLSYRSIKKKKNFTPTSPNLQTPYHHNLANHSHVQVCSLQTQEYRKRKVLVFYI